MKKFFSIILISLASLVGLLILLPIVFLFVYIFFFRPFYISGNSMIPNFRNGAYVVTSVSAFRFTSPKRGDAIIFVDPLDHTKDFAKRIVALPGDTLMIQNGNVYLNGQIDDETAYIKPQSKTFGDTFLPDGQPITIPEGNYFVMGDNRPFSADSRELGFVPQKNIIGKILFCYWNCK
jgi:signal peptidase I